MGVHSVVFFPPAGDPFRLEIDERSTLDGVKNRLTKSGLLSYGPETYDVYHEKREFVHSLSALDSGHVKAGNLVFKDNTPFSEILGTLEKMPRVCIYPTSVCTTSGMLASCVRTVRDQFDYVRQHHTNGSYGQIKLHNAMDYETRIRQLGLDDWLEGNNVFVGVPQTESVWVTLQSSQKHLTKCSVIRTNRFAAEIESESEEFYIAPPAVCIRGLTPTKGEHMKELTPTPVMKNGGPNGFGEFIKVSVIGVCTDLNEDGQVDVVPEQTQHCKYFFSGPSSEAVHIIALEKSPAQAGLVQTGPWLIHKISEEKLEPNRAISDYGPLDSSAFRIDIKSVEHVLRPKIEGMDALEDRVLPAGWSTPSQPATPKSPTNRTSDYARDLLATKKFSFNIFILNSYQFRDITGEHPPIASNSPGQGSPVSSQVLASTGSPWFQYAHS